MKNLVVLVAFLEFVIVTSLNKRKGVSLSLNAPNKIPIRGFLLDDNDDKVSSSKLKSIEKVMNSQQDQLNKILAASNDNIHRVSAIKSKLTDLSKAVNGSIEKVMDSQQDQMNKIKADLKDNSHSVSVIESKLTDLSKAVHSSIKKVMDSHQDQLNKIIAALKDNSHSVSAVKSKLTDLSKAVHGSIKKVMDSQQDQLNKITAASKDNSHSVSAIKSKLTDLSKVVNGLQKATVQLAGPASDGYIGCYLDDSQRHLKHRIKYFGNSITLAKCREHCKGYKYTGLQNSNHCLCGNELTNKKYPRVPESNCNSACLGETNRKCGAAWRNSIYLVKP